MKKLLVFLCAMSFVFVSGGIASALNFSLDSYGVTLNDKDPGLILYWERILTTPASRDLSVGESFAFDLFRVGTNERIVNWGDDLAKKDIMDKFRNKIENNINEFKKVVSFLSDNIFLLEGEKYKRIINNNLPKILLL